MKFKFECCKFAWRLISRVKFATRNGFRITAFCELCEKFVCGLNSFHDLPPSPPADPTTFMMAQHGVWVMGREGSAKDRPISLFICFISTDKRKITILSWQSGSMRRNQLNDFIAYFFITKVTFFRKPLIFIFVSAKLGAEWSFSWPQRERT